MSTPSPGVEGAAIQHAAPAADLDAADSMPEIPRRLMRVKVLYTFDDQNKSNCLARLPNALNIPTVSLDETTQLGVIDLKTCIQAIVSASPELVAKLGHDYTVYAYDFSEYETPLVGQGMLSWILASASMTPNAPAEESQTMVTGRVCKNIVGFFSNGIKETLEVKLKLVPVPTCMQSEYVENMERYHSLSKIMPEGMDYKEWVDFLKVNPAISQLAQPTPTATQSMAESMTNNAIESFNELIRNNSFHGHHRPSFSAHDTRASSPAMSTVSAYPYQTHSDYRPASQASFHSESAAHSPYWPSAAEHNIEQGEEGPPKKRARVTKAKRPKKTALGPNVESLRVTASTAASVRLHRPVPLNASTAVSAEQVPRAPTPRPRHAGSLSAGSRLPAPSLLRNSSAEEPRPYISPYDSGIFSDNAIDSADEDKGDSPSDTIPNMPSSPPVLPENVASPAPSSPELPMLPPPNDSGFASDMASAHNEEGRKEYENGASAAASQVRTRKKRDGSKRPWSEVNPGPSNLLPTSEIRSDQAGPGRREQELMPIDPNLLNHFLNHYGASEGVSQSIELQRVNHEAVLSKDIETGPSPPGDTVATACSISQPELRVGTPSLPAPPRKAPRGLARSQTWAGEPMSDATIPEDPKPKLPRSGSGARRQTKDAIKERLEEAITKGQLPTFCNNCGQIETPAWRHAYTRLVDGTPENLVLSSKGNAIVAYEIQNPAENNGAPHYRIFKNDLAPDGSEVDLFTTLTLCNPCGLWLSKKNAMRPQEVWGKTRAQLSAVKAMKKHKKAKADGEQFTSDAVMPESEPGNLYPRTEAEAPPASSGATNVQVQRATSERDRTSEVPKLDEPTARAALERAFQSSPVGVRSGSKDLPINIDNLDGELSPKPTRRLLFPSPRRPGQVKSLSDSNLPNASSRGSRPSNTDSVPVADDDVPMEDGDKENQPPPVTAEDDDFTHLFVSPKVTPTKGTSLEDMLKTPTPGSRQRVPLTPMRYVDMSLSTPSKSSRTPRGNGRLATLAPETPFTRQLNDLLSDSMIPGSPTENFDLSAFTTFNTPGRNSALHFGDFLQSDSLSSDLPIPSSSPPKHFDFNVFEDPNTSTVGLWSGASIFDVNDAVMMDAPVDGQQSESLDNEAPPKILTINGISLDFSSMIEEVVGNTDPKESESKALERKASLPSAKPFESRPHSVPKSAFGPVPAPTLVSVSAPARPLGVRPDLIPPPISQQRVHPPPLPLGEYDPPKPRCQRCKQMKKGCDRQRPCGRCVKAGLEADCCPVDEEPATSPAFSGSGEPTRAAPQPTHWKPCQVPVHHSRKSEAVKAPVGLERRGSSSEAATRAAPPAGTTVRTTPVAEAALPIATASGAIRRSPAIDSATPTAEAISAPTPDDLNTV